MTETGKTTRAQRMAMPLARDVVKDIAIEPRRLHPPGAAAPHRPDHRRNRTGARPVRAHPRRRSARPAPNGPRTCAPRNAAKAGTSTVNPTSSPTRPPMTSNGGSRTAPRSRPAATRPQQPGEDTEDLDQLLAELDEEISRAGMRGKVTPDRATAAPVHPAAARRPAAAAPQGRPADGRQDLHRAGRQDVPPVAVPHPHLPVLRARHRRRHTGRPGQL